MQFWAITTGCRRPFQPSRRITLAVSAGRWRKREFRCSKINRCVCPARTALLVDRAWRSAGAPVSNPPMAMAPPTCQRPCAKWTTTRRRSCSFTSLTSFVGSRPDRSDACGRHARRAGQSADHRRSRGGGGWHWVGVVSGLFNQNDSGVGALERRPRHEEGYHEGGGCGRRSFVFG